MNNSVLKEAEKLRQASLDLIALSKVYPDISKVFFKNEDVYISSDVNASNYKGLVFDQHKVAGMSNALISARLYNTVKRPNRPAIRVYSKTVYGFTIDHLVDFVNGLSPKSIMDKIGFRFKSQEKVNPVKKASWV